MPRPTEDEVDEFMDAVNAAARDIVWYSPPADLERVSKALNDAIPDRTSHAVLTLSAVYLMSKIVSTLPNDRDRKVFIGAIATLLRDASQMPKDWKPVLH